MWYARGMRAPSAWDSRELIRSELFSIERLERHAASLAAKQRVTKRPVAVRPLVTRLRDNGRILLAAFRSISLAMHEGRAVSPAADWLVDNYYVVEAQIQQVRDDLPAGYYRQLPKLADGQLAGYPRVFGIAWAFIAHTDSRFDGQQLRRFVAAYQRVQPLTIGELWALAITLRIVLVENLRRAAELIASARTSRQQADTLADRLLGVGTLPTTPEAWHDLEGTYLSTSFTVQLLHRLRDQGAVAAPALDWLNARLTAQATTPEAIVREEHHRQGASNLTVRNVITSMRAISALDWTELFESISLVDATLRDGSGFAQMDFPTRDRYRRAIEVLARGSSVSELDIALRSVSLASAGLSARERDPGYYLIGRCRPALERAIGFRPAVRDWCTRAGMAAGIWGYLAAIAAVTAVFLALPLLALPGAGANHWQVRLLALLGLIPAIDAAMALVNRSVTKRFGAEPLAALELRAGVPAPLRTLVAVPVMLTTSAALAELIARLEVHHLASPDGEIHFALLADFRDAACETLATDQDLVAQATAAIAQLNLSYGPAPGGPRFLFLHRRRLWSNTQRQWIGWERKRGKLHELNRLLRGATDTSFALVEGRLPVVPAGVRYVLTLDADTRLPRDAARRLVGKLAHPLNAGRFDATAGRVVEGYAILQPRVTPSLPMGREGSLYQRLYSSASGIDPYSAAVSDVYQDLCGEGSYVGKGIYEIDTFEAALAGRIPDGVLLSHDLFEGIFARAGLVSDVEVVEEYPARYDVAAARSHRWARGDWQLLPWLLGLRPAGGVLAWRRIPPIGHWKMLDNLRRTLSASASTAALILGWTLPAPAALLWTSFVILALALPQFSPVLASIVTRRKGVSQISHLRILAGDIQVALGQLALNVTLLAHQACLMTDAIVRTLYRLCVSHRRLLEWVAAAQAQANARLGLSGFYRRLAGAVVIGLAVVGLVAAVHLYAPLALAFAAAWLASPALAYWVSRSPSPSDHLSIDADEARALRLIARRAWLYFETFVTAQDHFLPPDNYQEDPLPVLAHRTSPTNLGLYLLSALSAHDFGWLGTLDLIERLESTLTSMCRLERFRGHFYNWYDTSDLRPLDPMYISTVDSGNLVAHLITLANGCDALDIRVPPEQAVSAAIDDSVQLAAAGNGITDAEAVVWTQAAERTRTSHQRDQTVAGTALAAAWMARLAAVSEIARSLAREMRFDFLYDPERQLLSIGYQVAAGSLDAGCYDLLASEARLASFVAIANGDLPAKHWFRLGRAVTPVQHGAALVSWSGSMFEYLMPSLVMRAPTDSLLARTNQLIVQSQIARGAELAVPWGISESAFNARDLELTYQYSSFGVPSLGLKRGLGTDVVIAPYATALAAMIEPSAALRNFVSLAGAGAQGQFGFYEALDYTPRRLRPGQRLAIVRAYMAHHQGMAIVALDNALLNGAMRARFHAEPRVQATELLLQERTPRDVPVAHVRADEDASDIRVHEPSPTSSPITASPGDASPRVRVLSNGRYAVMLTGAGAGYSRWRDFALTRWQEDVTRDDYGSFVLLRDVDSGELWSAGHQPTAVAADLSKVSFGEDRALFARRDGLIATALEVIVSAESDAEVRRVSISNHGSRARVIEVTSYLELVLAPAAADMAHPAFSKLFVQTDFVAGVGALLATRRRREPDQPEVWVAHLAIPEGETDGELQFETDRAKFLGRTNQLRTAAAITTSRPLSGTIGTVLDPIFSLRRRLRLAPGATARLAFWTLAASSRAEVLDLADKHRDAAAFERAATLAWTQAQVQLHHLAIGADEADQFQLLASHLLYSNPVLRPPSSTLAAAGGGQTALWSQGISGQLPILIVRIDDLDDIGVVRQMLRAFDYWRMKQLAVDIVILNERAPSYTQDLQHALEHLVRSGRARAPVPGEFATGAIRILRADTLSADARRMLLGSARVVLLSRRGSLGEQIERLDSEAEPRAGLSPERPQRTTALTSAEPTPETLEFFNGTGGFADDGREYVTVLRNGRCTPAPWINVIANRGFGFQVSAEGSGYTWARNSRDNQLTPWANDPVADRPGEALFVRDRHTGAVWSPTALPIRHQEGVYVARHGRGYSRFQYAQFGIALELLQFVPLEDPIKISRLTLRNDSGRSRHLSVTGYVEWVLGTSRSGSAPFIATSVDAATGALLARNIWSDPGERVAFLDLGGQQDSWTGDRREFLGRNGALDHPLALASDAPLSGRTGAGLDPCGAMQSTVVLAPGASVEVLCLLGEAASAQEMQALLAHWRVADLDETVFAIGRYWDELLGAVAIRTPDRSLDIMHNGWLLYQTMACRLVARSALYQASGAYGFRDQLQDTMALVIARPAVARAHLLLAAARQFQAGDVQHWWLPETGRGVRTRVADDRAWLCYCVAHYVEVSGDVAILDEPVAFLDGPPLHDGETDHYFQPLVAETSATLYEHCVLALDSSNAVGAHGLPLFGTGDWNDGMNRVGAAGRGESTWLAWFLHATLSKFSLLAAGRGAAAQASLWRARAVALGVALERDGWDGDWYRRGYFDDGSPLGSAGNSECRIDSIAQSWGVISGAADPARARRAMAAAGEQLLRPADGLSLLFTPPFDHSQPEPGYVQAYPPGIRENGGQYTHASSWSVIALAMLGDGDRAMQLLAMLNPINHALTPEAVQRYKVEPYVVAADVYSVPPHVGRGGWTWYTGSSAWMYRAALEHILGCRLRGATLWLDPCVPRAWPGFDVTLRYRSARYEISVQNPHGGTRGLAALELDGVALAAEAGIVALIDDGTVHRVIATIGKAPAGHLPM